MSARRVIAMSGRTYAASGLVLSHLCTAFGMEIELETRGRVAWAPRLASLVAAAQCFQSVIASLSVVHGLVAAMRMQLPSARRAVYSRIRKAFNELNVFG